MTDSNVNINKNRREMSFLYIDAIDKNSAKKSHQQFFNLILNNYEGIYNVLRSEKKEGTMTAENFFAKTLGKEHSGKWMRESLSDMVNDEKILDYPCDRKTIYDWIKKEKEGRFIFTPQILASFLGHLIAYLHSVSYQHTILDNLSLDIEDLSFKQDVKSIFENVLNHVQVDYTKLEIHQNSANQERQLFNQYIRTLCDGFGVRVELKTALQVNKQWRFFQQEPNDKAAKTIPPMEKEFLGDNNLDTDKEILNVEPLTDNNDEPPVPHPKPNEIKKRNVNLPSLLIVPTIIGSVLFLYFNFFKSNQLPFDEIKIGNQVWSSEINIPVPYSYCYDDVDVNCESFGRLYTLKAAQEIADQFDGWELPYDSDFEELQNNFDSKKEMYNALTGKNPNQMGIKLSGYGSQSADGKRDYFRIATEAAIWSNSRDVNSKDEDGRTKPLALRLIREEVFGSICDCWTISDVLTVRLIKTDRGNKVDFVNDQTEIDFPNYFQLEKYKKDIANLGSPVFQTNTIIDRYKVLIVNFVHSEKQIEDMRSIEQKMDSLGITDFIDNLTNVKSLTLKLDTIPDFISDNYAWMEQFRQHHKADMVVYPEFEQGRSYTYDKSNIAIRYLCDLKMYSFQPWAPRHDDLRDLSVLHYGNLTNNTKSIGNYLYALVCADVCKFYVDGSVSKKGLNYLNDYDGFLAKKEEYYLLRAKLIANHSSSDKKSGMDAYTKVLKRNSSLSEAYLERAPFRESVESTYFALLDFQNALDFSRGTNFQIFFNRAEFYRKIKKFELAKKDYKAAIKCANSIERKEYVRKLLKITEDEKNGKSKYPSIGLGD